ncbi:MAG: FAD-dependent oxidoreductase [Myxococcales bacterium]|nr:MAG: FAD-dependent oxidoreductase [Myxococcales bacterium]
MREITVEAAVVGAGTAGSGAALNLARSGMRVALIEHRRFEEAGARWINAIPPWMLDFAGVPRPEPPEACDHGMPVAIFTKNDAPCFILDPSPVWKTDMRGLVRRLHRLCRDSGVEMIDRARLDAVELDGGRPAAIRLQREEFAADGEPIVVRARLFIDATGLSGMLRRRVPALDSACPPAPPEHLCSAMMETCAIADPGGAKAFLTRLGAPPQHVACWFAVEGGFSTLNIFVDRNYRQADILVGAATVKGAKTGPAMLREVKARHPWLGAAVLSGAGLIPLRRPYDRLAAPGAALIGDAACQVFSAHGSGVGMGLVAGRLLADEVSRFYDPGSEPATWSYAAAFQRRFGATLAAYDLVRRLTQNLAGEETDRLLTSGLLGPDMMRFGLDQKLPKAKASGVASMAKGFAREPRLAGRMALTAARLPLVVAAYKLYPRRPDLDALAGWSRRVAKLFGEKPDLGG